MSDFEVDQSSGSSRFRMLGSIAVMCLSLGVAIYTANLSWALISRGEKATATCTEIEYVKTGTDSLDSPIWHVTYPTASGASREATVDASFARLKTGGTIEVLVDPLNPSVVLPNRWISLWGWPAAATFLSLSFFVELLRLRKRNAEKEEVSLRDS